MNGCQIASKECAGRLEWHHCLTKNRLKRAFPYGALTASLWHDPPRWEPATRYNAVTRSYFPDRISLDDILGDTRNRIFLCSHHHELVTNGRLEVTLPDSVYEFAAEFGLTAQLENDLARRRAA